MIKHALATIERGAVGNHAVGINKALSDANIETVTFAETIRPEFRSTVKSMEDLSSDLQPDDVVLYQFANPSPMADLLFHRPCRLIVNYHNITPAHYFSRWFPSTSAAISRARTQLARLAPLSSGAIAVSEFNAAELVALGYRNIEIIPPIFSEAFYGHDKKEEGRQTSDSSAWLFVGRIAPHKNIHILIQSLDIYRRHYGEAKLTIVGSCDTPLYGKAVAELIQERNLEDVVTLIEHVDMEDLVDLYDSSSVFVSASEHEGFCVPLVEAMASGLPVVAVDAAAVGDTAGSAAVLVPRPRASLIADAIAVLANDEGKIRELQTRGYVRSRRFAPLTSSGKYVDYLSEWI
ncbi:MAG TPA: glycosyltransferase [Acidimicrobiia bacterium]|nr:glycosyltransferase [Acidimicrobiia bacterium]